MSGETSKSPLLQHIQDALVEIEESEKKMPEIKIKRSLVNHDLDRLLVYTKRERKVNIPEVKQMIEKQKVPKNKNLQDKHKLITKIKTEVEKQEVQFKEQLISYKDIPNNITAAKIKSDVAKYQESQHERKKKSQEEKQIPKFQINQKQKPIIKEKQKQIKNQKYEASRVTKKTKPKRRQKVTYKDSDESQQGQEFPYTNEFLQNIREQHLQFLQECEQIKQQTQGQHSLASKSFINCDVRFFNWNFFADKVGSFDVVLIDPPWRIKGAQQNDSQFMFSNCKFSLEYNTMSNGDIESIQIQKLSKCGFIFVWILNTQLGSSLEVMNKWGYQLVDILIWVKMKNNKVFLTNGFYFMHSYEMCLIGYKSHPELSVSTASLLSNNVLFAEVRKKSQKPDELYHMIEMMFPTNNKIQVFARNNNLRFGWFSLGNQLGQSYDKWLLSINCDRCSVAIVPKIKRFKSRFKVNYDLCQNCITPEERDQFIQIQNQVDENVIHLYRSCNHCKTQPIWGNRFQCLTCPNFDICEGCFDQNLQLQTPFHDIHHEMSIIQIPLYGQGFAVHDVKCSECFQKPIIGVCFACSICKNFNLCQKCFFATPDTNFKRHTADHPMEAVFDPSTRPIYRKFECFSCTKQIFEGCYMCENCYNFFFCQQCHAVKSQFKTNMANNHKEYHKFIKIF